MKLSESIANALALIEEGCSATKIDLAGRLVEWHKQAVALETANPDINTLGMPVDEFGNDPFLCKEDGGRCGTGGYCEKCPHRYPQDTD